MPFDGTAQSARGVAIDRPPPVGNTLAALDITPVSRTLAEEHKRKVLHEYMAESTYNRTMVTQGMYTWTRTFYVSDFSRVRTLLANPSQMTPDRSAAPQPIVDLARVVAENIDGAAFSVEYFYNDPILNVSYRDDHGQSHHDCLGIWDQGEIVAIADRTIRRKRAWGGVALVLTTISLIGLLICVRPI